ncbi:MAG: hypothetical protein F6K36_04875 [Symploca sp. SIO3C6]|uniref:Uncharacterized protein n=1 Tax=Symploca sp. SIO1C4 TaxID=2607765 RepID=A0A6B3NA58_9CYAN|nr:hypothetical protein [Symploca sp. SIO3C6]NER26964.1 hypothetical protein [Symploca sp. SIO1C4]NET07094.1 hypothetical protein [Symploca sp. SIO2B6]NET54468.1 hypothetical protein [Merismopedia sp. SIO2A8]
MDQKRQDDYLNLIDELINCPNGQEPEVLEAKPELMDSGLVLMLVKVATTLAHQGNQETSGFLIHVARELSKALGLYPDTPIAGEGEGT